jgi:hypothetical protein
MAAKTTGTELQAFYGDKSFWPEKPNVWHEDLEVKVNGTLADETFEIALLKPDDLVTIQGGWIYSEAPIQTDCSFETYFRRWKKLQDTVVLLVNVPKDKQDAVKAAIKAAGGSIHIVAP